MDFRPWCTSSDIKEHKNSKSIYFCVIRRDINKFTISEFKLHLSYKSWDNVFSEDNANTKFNNFLSTYLRIFYHSFPLIKYIQNQKNKTWITAGIKKSCICKIELYTLSRNTKNPELEGHYRKYCKIVLEVTKTAKNIINLLQTWITKLEPPGISSIQ